MSGLKFQKQIRLANLQEKKYGISVDEINRKRRVMLARGEYKTNPDKLTAFNKLETYIENDKDLKKQAIIKRGY